MHLLLLKQCRRKKCRISLFLKFKAKPSISKSTKCFAKTFCTLAVKPKSIRIRPNWFQWVSSPEWYRPGWDLRGGEDVLLFFEVLVLGCTTQLPWPTQLICLIWPSDLMPTNQPDSLDNNMSISHLSNTSLSDNHFSHDK